MKFLTSILLVILFSSYSFSQEQKAQSIESVILVDNCGNSPIFKIDYEKQNQEKEKKNIGKRFKEGCTGCLMGLTAGAVLGACIIAINFEISNPQEGYGIAIVVPIILGSVGSVIGFIIGFL